jgi:hypothetical protein
VNTTTNYGLKQPEYSDDADIADLNYTAGKIDTALGGLGSGLAIVSIGNTHPGITAGQYVYVHDHSTLAEGLYKATVNIGTNGQLGGSNLVTIYSGGLNDLATAINSKLISKTTSGAGRININNLIESEQHFLLISSSSPTRFAILGVRSGSDGIPAIAEIFMGSNVSIYQRNANQITLQFDTNETSVSIYDILMHGTHYIT